MSQFSGSGAYDADNNMYLGFEGRLCGTEYNGAPPSPCTNSKSIITSFGRATRATTVVFGEIYCVSRLDVSPGDLYT